ncbi:DUF3055 domain-containing protein [Paenibacillus sp. KQZ6P-2]|uniref:DUF3055 domain-containing protein n=1 Tax=Paenibacillus mangrovi TaxID=2931978 RepID=A0A9X2B376_9BACL|nr:DUF3055 domain-containing protein [Paenibacillus mangrovi]MCJ8013349.1 DUF3055 domain-containing protein [Paenibacillus mangrovi]
MPHHEELDFLADSTEQTSTRFVTFIGPSLKRFDLAVTSTALFYGKSLVADLQQGISAVIGADDVEEPGYLEFAFKLGEVEAEELREFLRLVVGMPYFTD